MMSYRRLVFSCAFFGFLLIVGQANALVIDEFDGNGTVEATLAIENDSATVVSTSAIGGNRTLKAHIIAPKENATRIVARTEFGRFSQSAETQTSGITEIIWDGGSNQVSPNVNGLGTVDFTQDYADVSAAAAGAIWLEVHSNDLSGEAPDAQIELTVWNPSGFGYSIIRSIGCVNHSSCPSVPSTILKYPFSQFVGVDFKKVGAIRLRIIDGVSDRDISLNWIRTDAPCVLVPDQDGRVLDQCNVCGGDGTSCLDCEGVPFGTKVDDQCNVCGGDGTSCLDCEGVPFGTKVVDQCNVCGGDGTSCLDCEGVPFGTKVIDQCNVCGGDGTSCLDCEGVPFGTKVVDQCDICGGDGTSCLDCLNEPNGSAKLDICLVCEGDGTSCLDCEGVPFGTKKVDQCGVCGGDGKSCVDCEGVLFGGKEIDICNICGGDGKSCLDCFSKPFGPAKWDVCGVCGGDGTSCLDCENVPNGKKIIDECGVCGGDGTSCTCISSNSIETFEVIDETVNELNRLIRQTAKGYIGSKNVKFVKKVIRKAQLRVKNITTIKKTIETTTLDCHNEKCVKQEINVTGIKQYRKELRQLNLLIRSIISTYQNLGSGGACTRTPAECAASAKTAQANIRYIIRRGNKLVREGVKGLNSIPTSTYSCS